MKKQGAIFRDPHLQQENKLQFQEAFPEIKALDIEVTEQGPGNEGLGLRRFTALTVREYINCNNPDCTGKGLSMGDHLRQMLQARQNRQDIQQACEGSTPQGPCKNHFHVTIALTRH